MLDIRTTTATLLAALSLAAVATGSSAVCAKDHPVHSLYTQVSSETARQASRHAAEAGSAEFAEPTNRAGQAINYADYQRGGTN